ncbi:hypothetical protein [Thermotalea metallivorans]|uniref:Uncharacterized protein n=1 Tax=Thermotalea metallivorans TaxID=520762 RepID=A0A140L2G2_9FIRM|nr:hypothetical protein [Thermotalea metallivorans]KXG74737.1 hypothetical protein AN619_20770 [Thermotalea metallivorans]
MVILVILFYLIIGIIEIMPLMGKKQKKELVLYGVLYGIAFVTSILLSLGVDIPSPAKPIENIVIAIMGKQR